MLITCRARRFFSTVLVPLALAGAAQSLAEESLSERALYDRFMEDLFARPEEDASFLRSHELVVTVRVGGEFDPDTQVSVYREGPEVRAQVVRTPGRPVYEQISRLRSKWEDVGYSEVRASVTVKRREVSSRKCPRLEDLLTGFLEMEISSEEDPTLYAPSVTYQIWVSEGSKTAYYQMTGPSRQSDGGSYWGPAEPIHKELFEWVQELLSLVGGKRLGKTCG